jgi:hypothetical protein
VSHPKPGHRVPSKPTKKEVNDLAIDMTKRAAAGERKAVAVARVLVALFHAPWYLRVIYAWRILLAQPFRIPRKLYDAVNAGHLFAVEEDGGLLVGADPREGPTVTSGRSAAGGDEDV